MSSDQDKKHFAVEISDGCEDITVGSITVTGDRDGVLIQDSRSIKTGPIRYTSSGQSLKVSRSTQVEIEKVIGKSVSAQDSLVLQQAAKQGETSFRSAVSRMFGKVSPERVDALWNLFEKSKDLFG
jgi:hypothetical protein